MGEELSGDCCFTMCRYSLVKEAFLAISKVLLKTPVETPGSKASVRSITAVLFPVMSVADFTVPVGKIELVKLNTPETWRTRSL